jgi:quercetin dioxygenase-like cupin family protein
VALLHAQPCEVIDIRPLGPQLDAKVSTSLLKTDRLQLMRLVLQAGQRMPEHRVAGEITIQCLEGAADVVTPSRTLALEAGQLVMLAGGEPHAVAAREPSSLLVTILLDR